MRDVTLAGTTLQHYHVCAFFDSRDEEYDALKDYIVDGLRNGEKTIHICDPALKHDHRERLAQLGVAVPEAERTGQLEVIGWNDAYLKGDRFDSETMLALVDEVVKASQEQGFSHVRLMGHMEWALEAKPGIEQMMEYEQKVTDVLNRLRQPAICVYDLSKFNGTKVMEILRVHPYALIGGKVRQNPYYEPAAEAAGSHCH